MVRKINLLLLKTISGRVLDGFKLWKTIPEKTSKLGSGSEFEVIE